MKKQGSRTFTSNLCTIEHIFKKDAESIKNRHLSSTNMASDNWEGL